MVIKSTKILPAHLIKEEDIIKGEQVIDPVKILLNLTNPTRGNPLDYKGNVSRCRVMSINLSLEKRTAETLPQKDYNNLLLRPSTQLF